MPIIDELTLQEGLKGVRIGAALCGSYCTFSEVFPVLEQLAAYGAELFPIMSANAYSTDTKFGTAESHRRRLSAISGREIIHTIVGAEPIGPSKLLDILLVAPCTSNTLAKIALGINDTPVTMAVKSHLRNGKPVVLAVATNDALGGSAKNLGYVMNYKNIFITPMHQDDSVKKPSSMLAHFEQIPEVLLLALVGEQIQPIY